ncbi:hypothetical protein HOLleu_05262 [Holothuria leucospilota]|uniref:Uncharacterized protein n=1 Tax=Holothuria leucospilota TaxID=206669 RepID=A0A9Q1HIX8_HOLLE|nr:hypothetical protein HOLleu_05262 [Holothuria leucospilota]
MASKSLISPLPWKVQLHNSLQTSTHRNYPFPSLTGLWPTVKNWKLANILPVYRKMVHTKASNYRPMSLTSVSCKILQHTVLSHKMKHFNTYFTY